MFGKDNEVATRLHRAGFQRQFDLYVSSMSHVPLILLQTDLAVTMPRKLAMYVAQFLPYGLSWAFKLAKSHYNMVWHVRWDDVPSHKWMREAVENLMTGSVAAAA